ncbi:MAG TPA: FAD-binding protein, partial [Candidatus Acetothermia bacterium]|nr:FAD-binding protein [Candidatus Acetothermia bacterium]
MQELRNDILVIGSGGAGLRAAIAAASGGASVTLISKGPFGRSGATIIAGADIMADGSTLASLGYRDKPADSPDDWARDILIEGFNLNDENLVHTYVHGAGPRVRELLEWGMQIRGTEERALITTGVSIAASLRRGLAGLPVTNLSGVTMVDLLTGEGRVLGALGIDYESGELILVRAKAVVLATGGWHQAYSFNAGADELTGDGQGMAYRA